jgi:hypothetical protein
VGVCLCMERGRDNKVGTNAAIYHTIHYTHRLTEQDVDLLLCQLLAISLANAVRGTSDDSPAAVAAQLLARAEEMGVDVVHDVVRPVRHHHQPHRRQRGGRRALHAEERVERTHVGDSSSSRLLESRKRSTTHTHTRTHARTHTRTEQKHTQTHKQTSWTHHATRHDTGNPTFS